MQQAITEDLYQSFINFIDAKPKTIETYTRALKQFIAYLYRNNINQPQRADVIAFREELKATGHKPSTIQNYITTIRLFFQWTEQEHLYANIASKIKGAKIDQGHKKDYLTGQQVKTLINDIDRTTEQGQRDYAILSLMITTGLRTIEVIRADVGDLRVLGSDTVLYIQGKGHDEKTDFVKVSEPVEKAIREYLKTRSINDQQPLFASEANRNKGGRMTTRSISRIVKDNLINAGFNSDRLTAHSLRHTAATLNLLNGGNIEETQQLLRHTSINTTMIYSHHLDRMKNNSEDRVTKAIFG
ncbi:MAG: integrase [Epsilonproteobacteria bacterium]|nr:integrase [Campylobacterota bacterium]